MTVIKDRWYTARQSYTCDGCHKDINAGDRYRRLFGSAEASDPMHELILCSKPSCGGKEEEAQNDTLYVMR
ncbi:hypothetical protein [Brevibacillus laterosporus]|uniref:hypothetical protein n=1 Tax=Brevibacillus laterosporus TaxID=1465 RepID=UPI000E6C136E|nr:hypothetical protein [Brevibacillus laterosporus]AYB37628.1 hypothetical protein D5F52_04645 [Brevibacillus laterosporus]MBM7110872.1 hypothetical protein [Brevibacillus laterosporus]